ncbi:MAG: YbaB/EbfC family nucleoid-associated protein [Pygmaiobacter sp.]
MIAQYQKMQEDMESLTSELEAREHTVTAGGGQIELTMDGKYEVRSVKIKPEMVDPDDIELLEDLIAAAVNEGVRVVRETQETEMGALTGNMGLPAGFGL